MIDSEDGRTIDSEGLLEEADTYNEQGSGIGASIKDFDLKTAVIYSTILNRLEY